MEVDPTAGPSTSRAGADSDSVACVAPSRFSFTLTHGPAAGQTLAPKGFFLTVGRTRASKLHIKDAAVSERHAEVAWNGTGWVLKDVGSSNGTKLNGRAMLPNAEIAVLKNGDEITFGLDSVAKVQIEEQSLAQCTVDQLLQAQFEVVAQRIEARGREDAKALMAEWLEAKSQLLQAAS